jgi:hypothetical protein
MSMFEKNPNQKFALGGTWKEHNTCSSIEKDNVSKIKRRCVLQVGLAMKFLFI